MSFRKVIVGTAMMSAVRVLRLIGQLVAVPILSRLLSPAEYGVVAIAMPFALFAMMIADAGIGMSLVRTPASDRTAWSPSSASRTLWDTADAPPATTTSPPVSPPVLANTATMTASATPFTP